MSSQEPDNEVIITVPWVPPKNDTWKHILRPVTIFQLLQAEPSPIYRDKSLIIEGRGFAAVTLIAHVKCVDATPSGVSYILEDGTGKMFADQDLCHHGQGFSVEQEEKERTDCLALEHNYVEILGTPRKTSNLHQTRLRVSSIHPVHEYHQVMYHTLNVIHSNMLTQQHIQPYDPDEDLQVGSSENTVEAHNPVENSIDQNHQDDLGIQQDMITPGSHAVLPSIFLPQRHWPYATLKPLERAIIKHMCLHRNHPILMADLAQVIQASCGCTGLQFNVAIQALLSEAYITSPLDDGHVVITPRD